MLDRVMEMVDDLRRESPETAENIAWYFIEERVLSTHSRSFLSQIQAMLELDFGQTLDVVAYLLCTSYLLADRPPKRTVDKLKAKVEAMVNGTGEKSALLLEATSRLSKIP